MNRTPTMRPNTMMRIVIGTKGTIVTKEVRGFRTIMMSRMAADMNTPSMKVTSPMLAAMRMACRSFVDRAMRSPILYF